MEELLRPEKGKIYRLTYYKSTNYNKTMHSYDFEFMRTYGPKYYFFSEKSGIDLHISKKEFNQFLKNTELLNTPK